MKFNKNKKSEKAYTAFAAVFIAALAVIGGYIIFSPGGGYSKNENRFLSERPKFTLSAAADTSFQKKLSEFMSDCFPARDRLMMLSTSVKKIEGKKDFGGVYKGKNGYYFEKVTDNDINSGHYLKNLGYIRKFAAKHQKNRLSVMLVPSSSAVNSRYLPAFAQCYDQGGMYKTAAEILGKNRLINPQSDLCTKTVQTYYKTDHHWTTKGAYTGYENICRAFGLPCQNCEIKKARSDFFGTLFSKTLDSSTEPDSLYLPQISEPQSVTADGKNIKMFELKALGEKDKYRVFFGGNYGLVKIKTDCKNDKSLIVFKDSFANSCVPFLCGNYSEIIMVDYRYYTAGISSIINEKSDILFLYEMSNFANDKNLFKLGMPG